MTTGRWTLDASTAGFATKGGRKESSPPRGVQVRQGWRARSTTQAIAQRSLASGQGLVRQVRHASPLRTASLPPAKMAFRSKAGVAQICHGWQTGAESQSFKTKG